MKLTYGPGSNNVGFSYRESDPLITVNPDDRDSILNANPDYFDYKFEGFQIFQLANSDVSISDIYDPTQSRMVAQCDIKNGLDTADQLGGRSRLERSSSARHDACNLTMKVFSLRSRLLKTNLLLVIVH